MHSNRENILNNTIDIDYMINEKVLVTKNELTRTLPNEDYQKYVAKFMEQKLKHFYYHCHDKKWFIIRYLSDRKVDLEESYQKFLIFITSNKLQYSYQINYMKEDSSILLLRELQHDMSVEKFDELTKNLNCISKSINQHGIKKRCMRSATFLVDKEHCDDAFVFIKEIMGQECLIFQTSKIPIRKSGVKLTKTDLPIVQKYLQYFNERNQTNYEIEAEGEEAVIYGVLLLRLVFNFCIFCCEEFDSDMHMFLECGMYHEQNEFNDKIERKVFDRNNEIFFKQFVGEKYFTLQSEIQKLSQKSGDKIFCAICAAEIENESDIIKHLGAEHIEEVGRISQYCDNFDILISKQDPFLKKNLLGIKNTFPSFVNNEKTKGVKYDLPAIFSVEI